MGVVAKHKYKVQCDAKLEASLLRKVADEINDFQKKNLTSSTTALKEGLYVTVEKGQVTIFRMH